METTLRSLTPADVQKRVDEFEQSQADSDADRVVGAIFIQWPANTNLCEILAKVVILNQFYNTNIRNPLAVAKHILDLKIDHQLEEGEPTLVDAVARVKFSDKTRLLFSFATKYCAWHQPDKFQIFDRYVARVLWTYRQALGEFRREDLRTYTKFAEVVTNFCKSFKLESCSRKNLDKFLWIEGKSLEAADGSTYAGSDE